MEDLSLKSQDSSLHLGIDFPFPYIGGYVFNCSLVPTRNTAIAGHMTASIQTKRERTKMKSLKYVTLCIHIISVEE